MVFPQTMYRFGSAGKVCSWKMHKVHSSSVKLQVYRGSGSTYTLIGENNIATTSTGTAYTYNVPSSQQITVQAGDYIGLRFSSPATIPFTGGGSVRWGSGPGHHDVPVGSAYTFPGSGGRQYAVTATLCQPAGGVTCTKLSTLAENNFNNRGDTTLNTGTTYTYTTSCGYTVRLSGWSHTRNYAKGFLRNSPGTGRAVVEGLKVGKAYNYKIYQYASAYAGTNAYQVNGVSKGSTTSAASDAATATGTAVADSAGKVTFTFTRQTHHIHLSGIAIAEA
jgi:hypothetical protein